jgi:hypothetical protein
MVSVMTYTAGADNLGTHESLSASRMGTGTGEANGEGTQPTKSRIWPVLAGAILCAVIDFSLAPIFDEMRNGPGPGIDAIPFFGLVGCTLAQGNLLAAWLAWGEGPFLRRLLRHWLAALLLYCAWAIGIWLVVPPEAVGLICMAVGLGVPLVSLGAQAPLWIAREWLGWRIVRDGEMSGVGGERPMTIRGLMGATVLVAVSLTLVRLVPTMQLRLAPTAQPQRQEYWVIWIVAFMVAALISSIGMLPAGRLLLGIRRFRLALLASSGYAVGLIGLVWVVRELLLRYALNSGPPLIAYGMGTGLMLGYAATLMVAGAIARGLGYRMARGRRRLIR